MINKIINKDFSAVLDIKTKILENLDLKYELDEKSSNGKMIKVKIDGEVIEIEDKELDDLLAMAKKEKKKIEVIK